MKRTCSDSVQHFAGNALGTVLRVRGACVFVDDFALDTATQPQTIGEAHDSDSRAAVEVPLAEHPTLKIAQRYDRYTACTELGFCDLHDI
jgi:hypothetical protein